MLPRFYAPDIVVSGEGPLPNDEAEHASRVLRVREGDEVRVFDGRGSERLARVTSVSARSVRLVTYAAAEPAPESPVAITIAQAALTGDKMDDLVRDAVMLGAAAIQPIVSERTGLSRAALERARKVERWQRVALASVKQCGRAVLPQVEPLRTVDDYSRTCADEMRLLLVEPSAPVKTRPLMMRELGQRLAPDRAALLIGPEGGWTAEETEASVAAGWLPVMLGPRTLRADAVAVIAVGVLLAMWGDL